MQSSLTHLAHVSPAGRKFRRKTPLLERNPQVWGDHNLGETPLFRTIGRCRGNEGARENSARASAFGPPVLLSAIHKSVRYPIAAHLLAISREGRHQIFNTNADFWTLVSGRLLPAFRPKLRWIQDDFVLGRQETCSPYLAEIRQEVNKNK